MVTILSIITINVGLIRLTVMKLKKVITVTFWNVW